MNRTYKTAFNRALGIWQTVAETSHDKGKTGSALRIATGLTIALISPTLWACSGWGGNISVSGGSTRNDTSGISLDCSDNATVTGTGSQWNVQGDLGIGITAGNSTLNIQSGGIVTNINGFIGRSSGSTGTVTVDGSGSAWVNSSLLFIGDVGSGILTIQNGATVSNTNGYIAYNAFSSGTVTVTGAGSTWTNTGELTVGNGGTATLTIQNGATVSDTNGYIATTTAAGTTGTVTVDGAGSTWTNSGILSVGNFGTGALTIQNEGEVSSTNTVIGRFNGSNGTLNLDGTTGARGVLETGYVQKGFGSATFNWNGGILRAIGVQTDFLQGFSSGGINVQSGGAFIDTNGYNVGITTAGLLSGSGSLIKQGTGTLTMAGSNSYSGNTTVSAGILQFGSYNQTAGQTLTLGASSNSNYGKLVATSTATFNAGANLAVDVASVNTLATGQTLTNVISATTLNASTFNVTDNSALFNFNAVLDSNSVDLNVVANSNNGIASAVSTYGFGPALGAAHILDGQVNGTPTGDMATVITALGQLPTQRDVARAAAQTLPISSGTQSIQGTLGAFGRILGDRLGSGGSGANTGISTGDDLLKKQVWIKPFGSRATQNTQNGSAGYSVNTWGLAFGADAELSPRNRIGLAYGYAKTNIGGNTDLTGTAQDNSIESHVFALYGNRSVASDLDFVYQADIGLNRNKSNRNLDFGGLNRTASATYQTYSAHAGIGLNKTLPLNAAITLIPGIRADYTTLRSQGYSESGADALNLNVDANTINTFVVGGDARVIYKLDDRSNVNLIAGVGYDTINKPGNIVATYAGVPGQAFATPGLDHSPWIERGGIGYSRKTANGTDIAIRYDAEGRSGFLNQTASVKATWMF
jgi:T5SS/PEP-CTERM-associated repeat protein/autotransporter-associated beta strand protein